MSKSKHWEAEVGLGDPQGCCGPQEGAGLRKEMETGAKDFDKHGGGH